MQYGFLEVHLRILHYMCDISTLFSLVSISEGFTEVMAAAGSNTDALYFGREAYEDHFSPEVFIDDVSFDCKIKMSP